LSAAVGSWVNLTFVIDTAAKTYTFFKDGVKDNELTDKPLAMNMALYFEGDPSPNGLLCNQLRFSSGVTGSNIAKNSVLYLDDIDFTTGKTAVNPTFIKTVHSSGIDNNDFDNVPKDLTSFVVDLGCDVDPSSLNGRVSLTKSGGVTPDVAFSGAYFERKYTVTLITPAAPYTGYTVTFDEGVTAVGSFAGFVLGEAVTLTFTTEKAPFVITDMYFSEEPSAGGIISEIPVNAGTVYGNVNIIYDETLASSQDVTVFVTVYADKGEAGLLMKNVYFYKTTILPPVGKTYDTLEIPVNLSGVTLGGSSKIGIFARDNLTGMLPLSDTYFVNVKYS
jgi:hypothetical protein